MNTFAKELRNEIFNIGYLMHCKNMIGGLAYNYVHEGSVRN